MARPTIAEPASSRTWRILAPPGTSPAPVWPASSVSTTTFRVKYGACAPLRFSSMLSWPATGITRMLVTRGEDELASVNTLDLCTTRVSQSGFAYLQSRDYLSWASGVGGSARSGLRWLESSERHRQDKH